MEIRPQRERYLRAARVLDTHTQTHAQTGAHTHTHTAQRAQDLNRFSTPTRPPPFFLIYTNAEFHAVAGNKRERENGRGGEGGLLFRRDKK